MRARMSDMPGDFKQLPPATSKAPFIISPSVYDVFDFRVLRENRRVVSDNERAAELDIFHEVLTDISWGVASNQVRKFIIEAYVLGAAVACVSNANVEGNTAVFTKRRYRDKWNRVIVRRVAKTHNHALKIKGKCRAQGARGQFYGELKSQWIRKRARTQALWNLQLAGDWHPTVETKMQIRARPYMMRVMLVSNLAVDQRFANGTQGRLMQWTPERVENKKALPASFPNLLVRFVKEASLQKKEMFPDVDYMDVTVRQETMMHVRGEPVLVQIPVVPCNALTIHKTQALSIKHDVFGCLEGVFAQGQVYVLFSRVTDPKNLMLVGVPPFDLVDDVAIAWEKAGYNAADCFAKATSITGEWVIKSGDGRWSERIQPKYLDERMVPVKKKKLGEILNPQPQAAQVIQNLLDWIDRVDLASQKNAPRPIFKTINGEDIFPDEPWWLTDVQRRIKSEEEKAAGDEDGPASDPDECAGEDLADDSDPLENSDDDLSEGKQVHADPPCTPGPAWRHRPADSAAEPARHLTKRRKVAPPPWVKKMRCQERKVVIEWEDGLDGLPLRTEAGMRQLLELHDLRVCPSETHGRNDCLTDSLLLALSHAGLITPELTIAARSSICAAVRQHLVKQRSAPEGDGYLAHDEHIPEIFKYLKAQQPEIWIDAGTADEVALTVTVFDRFNGRRVNDANGLADELVPSAPVYVPAGGEGDRTHVQVQLYCCTHKDGSGWHYEWVAPIQAET